MLETLRNAWKVPEIRKKLLYTMLIIVIYRLGGYVPVPFLDASVISEMISGSNNIFAYLNTLSGGTFGRATLLCLSISPYINAQIIIQLLTFAIPALERLAKEGEAGRATINKITNGISMLLFAGIIAEIPSSFGATFSVLAKSGEPVKIALIPIIVVIFVLMIAFIIFMDNAERRLPVQYAKRVVGRKMYGGQSSYLPIKIAMAGVLPIIFAMSFLSIPQTIQMFMSQETQQKPFWAGLFRVFSYTHPVYATIYFILIILFSYFYVSIQYNPVEIANNLRQNNGGVPGIRPGNITRILSKLILVGALFLGVVAIFPIIFAQITGVGNLALGGTSILIVVSVALETVRQLESQMMMRHHKGFLE